MMRTRWPMSALRRKALSDLTRRKGRTLLVVAGILIGVLGLTAINVTDGALAAAFAYTASTVATPDITVTVPPIDPALGTALSTLPNVTTVQLAEVAQTQWVGASPINLTLVAYATVMPIRIDPFQLTSGRLPSGPNEVVMEAQDRAFQPVVVGDAIRVQTSQQVQDLHVVGLVRTQGLARTSLGNQALAYMSLAGLNQITGIQGANTIVLQVQDHTQVQHTSSRIVAWLQQMGIHVLTATVTHQPTEGPVTGVFIIMRALALLALLLTAFLIYNTIATVMVEQTAIMGTMKALGATRGTILRQYLLSVLLMSSIGTMFGICLGSISGLRFVQVLAALFQIDVGPSAIAPMVFLVSGIVGVGVPLLAALLPVWNATRITVRTALGSYGVVRNGEGGGVGTGRRWRVPRWVPETVWLGLHSVFRRRGRALVTVLALSVAGSAFLAIQTTAYAADQYRTQLYALYSADVTLTLASPVAYVSLHAQIAALPNVAQVERQEGSGVETRWGTMALTGMEPTTHLYHYGSSLVQGRWFQGDEPGVLVISDYLAQRTGLRVGDHLTFSSPTTTVTDRVIGVIHDLSGSFGGIGLGITPLPIYQHLFGESADQGVSFWIGARNHEPQAVDTLATQLAATLNQSEGALTVTTRQQQMASNARQFLILYALLYAGTAIIGLVCLLGVFDTLTATVVERQRELGILRALGASSWQVIQVVWTEGLAVGAIAWLVAVGIGIPAAYGFLALVSAVLVPIPFAFTPTALGAMLLVVFVIATLASLGPALRAARLRIVETLRYE